MNKSLLVSNPNDADILLVVDIHNISWKSYYSPVQDEHLVNGYPTYHQYIALNKLSLCIEYIFENHKNKKLCLVFSQDEYCENKKKLFPEYKSGRNKECKKYMVETKDGFTEKEVNPVNDTSKALSFLPHCKVSIPTKDAETDDIIATFCKRYSEKEIYIESSDKDLWQLRSKSVHLIYSENPLTILTKDIVLKKFYNKDNRLIPLIKTLIGDASDKLVGVSRFPRKLIRQFSYDNYKGKIKKGLSYVRAIAQTDSVKQKIDKDFDRLVKLHSIIKLNKHLPIKEEYIEGDYSSFKKFLKKRKIKQPRILTLWILG